MTGHAKYVTIETHAFDDRVRWECALCPTKRGQWVRSKDYAEQQGERHAAQFTPKIRAKKDDDVHELRRIDEERCDDGSYRWRWVCVCHTLSRGGLGQWTYQSDNVARVAHQRHAERFSTKD